MTLNRGTIKSSWVKNTALALISFGVVTSRPSITRSMSLPCKPFTTMLIWSRSGFHWPKNRSNSYCGISPTILKSYSSDIRPAGSCGNHNRLCQARLNSRVMPSSSNNVWFKEFNSTSNITPSSSASINFTASVILERVKISRAEARSDSSIL